MTQIFRLTYTLLRDITAFNEHTSPIRLRGYQIQVARAVAGSVLGGLGLSFVVMFPRQSGKNELQAQIEAYLLAVFYSIPGSEIVKVSPTWKPQAVNAMRRLERTLERNLVLNKLWKKESGYIYRAGEARVIFLSANPEAHIVGATASLLLEVDEAQDVQSAKFDKEILPMAASTNATRLFWGTAWTSQTLLSRELRAARKAERKDGLRRVFTLTAERVRREVPAYGRFVESQVSRLGRQHPFIRTQFYSEEIDGQAGMFPPPRRQLMQGEHAHLAAPGGGLYAFLIDVGGGEESAVSAERLAGHDATALTIVELDLGTLSDPLIAAPTYRVVERHSWQGTAQSRLYAQIKAQIETWTPSSVVIDATGVGAGLASFLIRLKACPVIPFEFNLASKSRLGWDFLAIVETGRFKDWQPAPGDPEEADRLRHLFERQCEFCEMEVLPGPQHSLRWGVPEGRRDPLSGERLHDDLLVSAALCAALERQPWGGADSQVVAAADPLQGFEQVF